MPEQKEGIFLLRHKNKEARNMSAETKLDTLYRVASGVFLDKETAKKFVGGRYRLEKLISEKKIRAEKTGTTKMSPYAINACDVLLYAIEPKGQRI